MDRFPAKRLTSLIRFYSIIFLLINVGIAFWYLRASAWVLGGQRIEVLTGDSYGWPLRIRLVSLLLAIFGVTIIVSTLCLRFSKWYGHALVMCIALLACLELLESTALSLTYGWDLMLVLTPAALFTWAFISALYLRRREA